MIRTFRRRATPGEKRTILKQCLGTLLDTHNRSPTKGLNPIHGSGAPKGSDTQLFYSPYRDRARCIYPLNPPSGYACVFSTCAAILLYNDCCSCHDSQSPKQSSRFCNGDVFYSSFLIYQPSRSSHQKLRMRLLAHGRIFKGFSQPQQPPLCIARQTLKQSCNIATSVLLNFPVTTATKQLSASSSRIGLGLCHVRFVSWRGL